jgi:hypothetical protein
MTYVGNACYVSKSAHDIIPEAACTMSARRKADVFSRGLCRSAAPAISRAGA